MIIKRVLFCSIFLAGIFVSLQTFASDLLEPDPSFQLTATFFPIDGGKIHIGNIDKDKKTFPSPSPSFWEK